MKSKKQILNRSFSNTRKFISKQIASMTSLTKNSNISPEELQTLEKEISELKSVRLQMLKDSLKERIKLNLKQTKLIIDDLKIAELRKEIFNPGILYRINGLPA